MRRVGRCLAQLVFLLLLHGSFLGQCSEGLHEDGCEEIQHAERGQESEEYEEEKGFRVDVPDGSAEYGRIS